jgi:hypothetical protein
MSSAFAAAGATARLDTRERLFSCPLCWTAMCRLRLDKRGKPYLVCASCGSRMFVGSAPALSWVMLVAPDVVLQLQAQSLAPASLSRAPAEQLVRILDEATKNNAGTGGGDHG